MEQGVLFLKARGRLSPGQPNPICINKHQGNRRRKNLAGVAASTGIVFENAPELSRVPVAFVVQTIGGARLVVLSHVYPPLGGPPAPVKIKLPPDWVIKVTGGTVTTDVEGDPKTLISV